MQFNRVFEGRVGVCQDFVDHHVVQREKVGVPGRRGGLKAHNEGLAIRQAAFGNALGLRTKGNLIDGYSSGRRNDECLTTGREAEVDVVRARPGVVVRFEALPRVAADANK